MDPYECLWDARMSQSDPNLNCVPFFTEDGHSECGSEDRGASWIWKDLQKWYNFVSNLLMACFHFLLECGSHCFLCVISNQHGLTMPMHVLYSTPELELWKLTSQGTVLSSYTTGKWPTSFLSWLHYNCLISSPGQGRGPDGGCWWMVGIQLFVTTKITSLMDSDRSICQLLSLGSFFSKKVSHACKTWGALALFVSLSFSLTHTQTPTRTCLF